MSRPLPQTEQTHVQQVHRHGIAHDTCYRRHTRYHYCRLRHLQAPSNRRQTTGTRQGGHCVPQDAVVSVQFCLRLLLYSQRCAPAICTLQGVRCLQTSAVLWSSAGPLRSSLLSAAEAANFAAHHHWLVLVFFRKTHRWSAVMKPKIACADPGAQCHRKRCKAA